MPGYEASQYYGLPLNTTTTMGATGATTLVAAPAAGSSIVLDSLRITLTTDTSSRTDIWIHAASLTASAIGRSYTSMTLTAANGPTVVDKHYNPPLHLPSATALLATLSIAAASTPGASIEVAYRIFTR